MLITVDNKGVLRSNLISAATYNVETLQFAISTDLAKENEIYLSIYSTSNKLYDVVHLVPTRVYDSKHDLFTIAQSQSLRVGNNERVILKLLFLNKFKNNEIISNCLECRLNVADYNFSRQISLLQEVSLTVASYYEKITSMYNQLVMKEETVNDNTELHL